MTKAIVITKSNVLALTKEFGLVHPSISEKHLVGQWLVTPFDDNYDLADEERDRTSFAVLGPSYFLERYKLITKFTPDGWVKIDDRVPMPKGDRNFKYGVIRGNHT